MIALREESQYTDPPHSLGLLPARRERPRSSRTADKSDELASPHGLCLSARTTRYQIKQCCAAQQNLGANDRFGSFASMAVEATASRMSASLPKADN